MVNNQIQRKIFSHLLGHCGNLKSGEPCLVVVDETTKHLAPDFLVAAEQLGSKAIITEVQVADRHGKEPSDHVAKLMLNAKLVLGFTKMSMAHTKARQEFCAMGGRYLSLPGYTEALINDPCILANYQAQLSLTKAITDAFTLGSRVRVTTEAGTDITLDIRGRVGNCCPGFVNDHYNLGSPPDIESNVSPVENASEGVAVIDGSVACDEIGLLGQPIHLKIREGKIVDVKSSNPDYVHKVNNLFARIDNPKAYILAECGVGLNPLAQLTGHMLTDEGAMGCVHFGFGSNSTVGGLNDVPFHVDFIMRNGSLWIDDHQILNAGQPCL
jgi:leucyl aminopeptidase (aminopeptidase T)